MNFSEEMFVLVQGRICLKGAQRVVEGGQRFRVTLRLPLDQAQFEMESWQHFPISAD